MDRQTLKEATNVIAFGKRRSRPRIYAVEGKPHIRAFLKEALEDPRFVTCECACVEELATALAVLPEAHVPDLVILGPSVSAIETDEILRTLAAKTFDGKVIVLGPPAQRMTADILEFGEQLGIEMLPILPTPFSMGNLRDRVVRLLLPIEGSPAPPIQVGEALRMGWLELWYQPEIDTRTLALRRAEALIRIRHPTWGIVPPAYFIPDDGDPHFRALSEFVVSRAIQDWHDFLSQQCPIELAINLPVAFLQDSESVQSLCRQLPDHADFDGLIIEVNGTEVIRNLDLMKDVAMRLRFHKIAIAIDDLGAEWPLFAGLNQFPFVEIKVDKKFVAGCAVDRLKQTVCRRILELADGYGARTVAEGVETKADFLAVRDMGFDKVQGFYFARPASAKKFARTILAGPVKMPN